MSGLPERFTQTHKTHTRNTDPTLSIYANDAGGHINAAAVRQLFDEPPEALLVGADPDAGELAFVPGDPANPHSYALSQDTDGDGGDVRFGRALDRLGIDPDDLERTRYAALTREGDAVVADLSELVDGVKTADDVAASDAEPSADKSLSADKPDPAFTADQSAGEKLRALLDSAIDAGSVETTCGHLGDVIGEDGRKVVHLLKEVDGFAVEKTDREDDTGASIWRIARGESERDDAGEDDDGERDPSADGDLSESTVRKCAHSAETVQALADLLDVTDGRARSLVHEYDLDLADRPPRPGVER